MTAGNVVVGVAGSAGSGGGGVVVVVVGGVVVAGNGEPSGVGPCKAEVLSTPPCPWLAGACSLKAPGQQGARPLSAPAARQLHLPLGWLYPCACVCVFAQLKKRGEGWRRQE